MQQQRVLLLRGVLEVPLLQAGVALDLLVHARARRRRGRSCPSRRPARSAASWSVTPSWSAYVWWRHGRVGGDEQVPLRHQVRVDVVVLDRGVLVGAGHPVDVEHARAGRGGPGRSRAGPSPPAAPARPPARTARRRSPGRSGVRRRRCRRRCGTRRCPAGQYAEDSWPFDGPPREGRAGVVERAGPVAGRVQGGVAPVERVGAPPRAGCRSAPAARTSRCPRRRARRSRGR